MAIIDENGPVLKWTQNDPKLSKIAENSRNRPKSPPKMPKMLTTMPQEEFNKSQNQRNRIFSEYYGDIFRIFSTYLAHILKTDLGHAPLPAFPWSPPGPRLGGHVCPGQWLQETSHWTREDDN